MWGDDREQRGSLDGCGAAFDAALDSELQRDGLYRVLGEREGVEIVGAGRGSGLDVPRKKSWPVAVGEP
jgi:hypothetical protein